MKGPAVELCLDVEAERAVLGLRLPDVVPAIVAARTLLPIRGRSSSITLIEFDRDLRTPVRHLAERPLVSA